MPKVGKKIFAYTDEGMKQAAAESAVSGIPVSDGAGRNVTEYAGGGNTGYNSIGNSMYENGGKVTLKTSSGQVNQYPDTEKGRRMREEDKIADSIKTEREAKAKKEAESQAKAKKAEDIKKSQARAKKDKKAGAKKYGKSWAQGELEDMGSGRE